jgi:ABC-type phosphate transport system substrate-binding protein
LHRFFHSQEKLRNLVARISLLAVLLGFFGSAVLTGAAKADTGPQTYSNSGATGDIVCVGSDTVQFIGNFVADGDFLGHAGFNGSGATRQHDKLVSIDATGDANARFSYDKGGVPLQPSVVLRQGQKPIQRPNGSGAGIDALTHDTPGTVTETVNCARASGLPSAAQYAAAAQWGGLHVARSATETLGVAVNGQNPADASTSCADPRGFSVQQLAQIYTTNNLTWGGVTGWANPDATCSGHTIHPLLPQVGSGTRNKFLGDIGVAPASVAAYVNQFVEENDPAAITNDPAPRDAIVPFSGSRLNLWNGGFFLDPHQPLGTPVVLVPNVHLLPVTGSAGDANAVFRDDRNLYFIWRASDDNGPAWSGNSNAANWVHALFLGSSSFFGRALASRNDVQAAGAIWAYKDCGINPTTC